MKKYYVFSILVILLIIFFYIIQTFYINPLQINRIENILRNQSEFYIVYKNSHRNHTLYLSDKKYSIKLSENEVWNKPKMNDSINKIINPSKQLYGFSKIGDQIYKIENSNQCFIKRNDTLFLFNYLDKNEKGFDEWNDEQIGKFFIRNK